MHTSLLLATTLLAAVAPTATPVAKFACWTRGSTTERPSPLDSAAVEIGGAVVKVCYGRPSVRGRKIMGGLVPLGEPWRLGANEATTIDVPFPAEIAGVHVQPGTYTLYAIPEKSSWRVVVNRVAKRWGIPIDATVRAADVGTGTVKVEKLNKDVELLTLRFAPPAGNKTELIVEWEQTRVRVPVRRVGS